MGEQLESGSIGDNLAPVVLGQIALARAEKKIINGKHLRGPLSTVDALLYTRLFTIVDKCFRSLNTHLEPKSPEPIFTVYAGDATKVDFNTDISDFTHIIPLVSEAAAGAYFTKRFSGQTQRQGEPDVFELASYDLRNSILDIRKLAPDAFIELPQGPAVVMLVNAGGTVVQ